MEYIIVIPGEPFGKQRPRHGKGFTYTPKETVSYENLVKLCFVEKYGLTMLEGEITAEITAYSGIPKSKGEKQKALMRDGVISPTKKPDADNIAKAVLDSLNKVAYADDSAIVDLRVIKRYSDRPRVEVRLRNRDTALSKSECRTCEPACGKWEERER